MEVADRIVVMNRGRIEQAGTPDEVYEQPASPFVLQFLGDANVLHGAAGAAYVRPHELEILAGPAPEAWAATLSQALGAGGRMRLEFERDAGEGRLDVELARAEYAALRERLALQRGSRVWLRARKVTRFEPA